MRDTNPAATARYYELIRTRSPAERLEMASALTSAVRELALAGIRRDHPGLSARELQVKLAQRMYGRAVAERLFAGEGRR